MVNLVISQFQDMVKHFYKSAQAIRQEMENNEKTFAPDYARELNIKLSEQLRSKAQRSKDLITEILSETLKKLSVLACPNASELDSADYHLLTDKNYIANALDFEIIAHRHKTNFTFLRALKNLSEGKNFGIKIYLPEERAKVYLEFAQSAINLIEKISLAPSVSATEIDSFADPDFGKQLFEVVGEGKELDTVSLNGKSELETSRFDSYKLNPSPLSVAAFNA
ncbi:hypothetical protein [Ruminococcus sp.]|uniref:hypothetical protein n=1 Tax=Ruminococcus sp. TaxID=41978 RepID=UPI002E7A81E2|nr:hypothetical protein [Ruminococcus sp.]MEE1264282.1 hypothetical protein [Ruminococcus sp.]